MRGITVTTRATMPIGVTPNITPSVLPGCRKLVTDVCTVTEGIMVPTVVSIFAFIPFSFDLGVFSGVGSRLLVVFLGCYRRVYEVSLSARRGH